jgi:hypothetical protein
MVCEELTGQFDQCMLIMEKHCIGHASHMDFAQNNGGRWSRMEEELGYDGREV